MKKGLLLITVLGCLFLFCACGSEKEAVSVNDESNASNVTQPEKAFPQDVSGDYEIIDIEAMWDGYPEMAFDEYLSKGISAALNAENDVKKVDIEIRKGWRCDGLLDESSLTDGLEAVTYVADVVMNIEGEDIILGFKYYMELSSDNMLKVVAAETYREGSELGDVLEAESANEMLSALQEFI